MILIGQYDSPFVRRVAIALRLYGVSYEHRPWSVFGEGEEIAAFNPASRIPTLVLDDGEVLIESTAILDWLDESVDDDRVLISRRGSARRRALKTCALAMNLADKTVALVYERVLHEQRSPVWSERCARQIGRLLDALEAEHAAVTTPFRHGDRPGHADIAEACALRLTTEAHAGLFGETAWEARWPKLIAHAATLEALEVFQAVQQAFNPPR